MRYSILTAFSLSAVAFTSYAAEITWEVANRFQQFKNEADFRALQQAWPEGASAEEFLTGQRAQSLRQLLPIQATQWNKDTGLYDKAALFAPNHDVLIQLKEAKIGTACSWIFSGRKIAQDVDCTQPLRVKGVKESSPFTIAVQTSDGQAATLPAQIIRTSLILALGDSFASGEGNPDHAAVTTAEPGQSSVKSRDWFLKTPMGNHRFIEQAHWWDETCHRSLLSWQALYALQKGMNDPHLVVRFASFACSGAEVYDGFFRAQLSPPGSGSDSRVKATSARDGGNVSARAVVRSGKGEMREDVQESTAATRRLNKSQLNAAIDLLCVGASIKGNSKIFAPQAQGLRSSPYYGKFEYDHCIGRMRKSDETLLSFGGNDFGFSSVVKWGLFAQTPMHSEIPGVTRIRKEALDYLRTLVGTIDPHIASAAAVKHTEQIYSDMAWTLDNVLGSAPETVTALVYPNPLPSVFPLKCSARMEVGNVALTQYFMEETKKVPFLRSRANNFIFRIEPSQSKEIVEGFIKPLQIVQRRAIDQVKWHALEAQSGFESGLGVRTICAVAPSCGQKSGAHCSVADLYGWAVENGETHSSTLPIKDITEWEAYDPTRMRGLRTGNDSVLTQASFDANKRLADDSLSGVVHPVAQVHAAIASVMAAGRP